MGPVVAPNEAGGEKARDQREDDIRGKKYADGGLLHHHPVETTSTKIRLRVKNDPGAKDEADGDERILGAAGAFQFFGNADKRIGGIGVGGRGGAGGGQGGRGGTGGSGGAMLARQGAGTVSMFILGAFGKMSAPDCFSSA